MNLTKKQRKKELNFYQDVYWKASRVLCDDCTLKFYKYDPIADYDDIYNHCSKSCVINQMLELLYTATNKET
jgi:hypothetical protein